MCNLDVHVIMWHVRSVADRSIVHFPPQLNAPNHGSSNPFMGEWPCVWRWWTSLLNTCICTVVCRRVCPCFFSNSLYRFIHSMETHEENTAVDSIAKQYVCDRCGRTNFVDVHALGDHKKHCNNKKQCTKCKQTKTFTEFYKDGSKRDGLDSHCKVCRHAEAKQNDYAPDYSKMKQCTKCKQTKAPTEFYKHRSRRDGLYVHCKVCVYAIRSKQKKYEPDYSKKKQCNKCKQTKAPTEFPKKNVNRDGLDARCKVCRNSADRDLRKTTSRTTVKRNRNTSRITVKWNSVPNANKPKHPRSFTSTVQGGMDFTSTAKCVCMQ